MPYIKQENRKKYDDIVNNLSEKLIANGCTKGDYNYVITRLMHLYIKEKGISYSKLSDVVGILRDVGTEFDRTVVAPYEEKKIKENGNIGILS